MKHVWYNIKNDILLLGDFKLDNGSWITVDSDIYVYIGDL